LDGATWFEDIIQEQKVGSAPSFQRITTFQDSLKPDNACRNAFHNGSMPSSIYFLTINENAHAELLPKEKGNANIQSMRTKIAPRVTQLHKQISRTEYQSSQCKRLEV